MRLARIRREIEAALQAAGINPDTYIWVSGPNRLIVARAGRLHILPVPGSLSHARLQRILGRIDAWGDMARAAA